MLLQRITLSKLRLGALGISLLLLAAGGGYWLGQHRVRVELAGFRPPRVEVVNKVVPPAYREIDFALFWQVWEELERSYLDPSAIDPEKMVYGAIAGMTSALGDPYTAFLAPDENRQNKENLSGSFFGVGIQIGYKDGRLAVIAPLKDTPAQQAGIEPGDFILRIIDPGRGIDRDTQGIPIPEAVSLIRGDRGTTVTLRLFREGVDEPFDVNVTRSEILIPSVELVLVTPDDGSDSVVAHLKLMQFGERTKEEWDKAIGEILESRPTLSGVVLDMRNNPGGYLSGAVEVASEFLSDGTVVIQQGRYRSETFEVREGGRLDGIPVVVLVNQGSASASEIVAGALRDRRGIQVVGEETFGKGTVQEARDLAGGAGLHVTTSKWVLPSGQEISERGLTPDVTVELVKEEAGQEEVDEQLEKAIEVLLES